MKESQGNDEYTIIKACREGQSWAQRALYDQYAPSMLAICMRYVPDRETAKDLLQEGFIKVFTKIDSYAGSGAFGGWVRRVFVTTALEYLRHNDVLKESGNIDDMNVHAISTGHSVVDELTAQELMDCVTRLPDGYRTVFNLYVIEGYSHSEIAEMLNINEVTSRTQFMRARKILQKEIEQLYKTRNVI